MKSIFTKMKREDRNLLIVVIIFLIFIVLYGGYYLINKIVEKNKNKKNVNKINYIIINFDKNKIEKINIKFNNKKIDEILLEKKDGKWEFVLPKKYEISESSIETFLMYFSSLDYKDYIDNYNTELLEACGFYPPLVEIYLYENDGKDYAVFLGNETVDKNNFYIMYNEKIYIVDSFTYFGINKKVSDFRQNKLFANLKINEVGFYFFGNYIDNIQNNFYLFNNNWVWKSNYQKEYYFNIQNPAIDNLNKNLLNFEIDEFDLKYKHIKKPDYVLEIKSMSGEVFYRFYIIESDEEGDPENKEFILYDELNKKAYKAKLTNIYSYFTQSPEIFIKIKEEQKE